MRRPISLRSRLIIGSLLWTVGLVIVVNHLSLSVVRQHRIGLAVLHFSTMFLFGIGLLVVGIVQAQHAMSLLRRLRDSLMSVRIGTAPRVDGRYPSEVQPVVDELNALLEHRERAVARAVARAGDLAHGLKTPLAILGQEADRARTAGHHALADAIAQEVERMRRQIDYHLAHARAAASGANAGTRSSVAESAEGLSRTLHRLHADRGITIDVRVDPRHVVRVQREDLDEMLGNLLDNACKWTRTRVLVESSSRDGRVAITIDDDGPGVAAELREKVMRRGVRSDEAAPGSGFGLAIVADLVEVYGGSIALGISPAGGLQARLELPAIL